MSAASARFSSSRRSMRSMKDLSRSPATPPRSAIAIPRLAKGSVLVAVGRRGLLLGGRGFRLVLGLPLIVGHTVDDLARGRVRDRHAALFRGLPVPAREAVAAEAREIHEVEVLHICALAQMLHQLAEGGGF